MLKKNQWYGNKYGNLFTTYDNNSDLNISWSSSNSDEDYCAPKKKFKRNQNKLNTSNTQYRENIKEIAIVSDNSQFTCEILDPDSGQDKPSPSSNHSFKESPIIGNLRLVELSPLNEISETLKISPVIGGCNSFRNRVKKSVEDRISSNGDTSSAESQDYMIDSDSSDSSKVIGRNRLYDKVKRVIRDTDDKTTSNEIIENSPSNSPKTYVTISSLPSSPCPLSNLIDPFSDQEGLNLSPTTMKSNENEIVVTESTQTSSSKSSLEQLYYEISPRKKTKCKKDGFGDQLQNALNRQQTDFAIWRHEVYLQKSKNYNIASMFTEDSILYFKIIKVWKEFNVTVTECEDITNEIRNSLNEDKFELPEASTSTCDLKSKESLNLNNSKKCLIVIGFNVMHKLRIKPNAKFKLCMPYKTKFIKYDNELVACYFNVSKILSIK